MAFKIKPLTGIDVDGQLQKPDEVKAKINELVEAVNLLMNPQSANIGIGNRIGIDFKVPVQKLHGQGDGDPESISDTSKEGQ